MWRFSHFIQILIPIDIHRTLALIGVGVDQCDKAIKLQYLSVLTVLANLPYLVQIQYFLFLTQIAEGEILLPGFIVLPVDLSFNC